ncbi:MAG: universal stress protein [Deltaproteobacteria bacterium]|nr:universal stress protein [Deltaproteobacteria bacterium]
MFQRILIILENEEVYPPALTYARQLARRMDAEAAILLLAEMAFRDRAALGSQRNALYELEERAGQALTSLAGEFLRDGITVSVALRPGDPLPELMKFLAERPPFQVIIWGSSQELPAGGKRSHWLGRAAGALECPVWAVGSRQTEDPGE